MNNEWRGAASCTLSFFKGGAKICPAGRRPGSLSMREHLTGKRSPEHAGDMVELGKVTAAVGLRGEVRVFRYSGTKGTFENRSTILVAGKSYPLEHVRYQKNMAVLKLGGVDDRTAAEHLRGAVVEMPADELPELADGSFYIRDLLGMTVLNEEDGKVMGSLSNVLTDRAQDIYVVRLADGREIMVPAVKEFIRSIDGEKREIRVTLIEGMME